MNEKQAAITLALLVVLVVGMTIGVAGISNEWRRATVDRGLALYCPTDGQWAWVGECKE